MREFNDQSTGVFPHFSSIFYHPGKGWFLLLFDLARCDCFSHISVDTDLDL